MAIKRILITGAAGMLGRVLCEYFSKSPGYQVSATARRSIPAFDVPMMVFDLSSHDYTPLINWADPDLIIHCAAITDMDYCQNNPEEAFDINAHSVSRILNVGHRARIIFISSDAVFGNEPSLPNEENETAPISIYGMSKQQGERYIIAAGLPHCSVRTTIVGYQPIQERTSFVDFVLRSYEMGKTISLFEDNIFTPISVWDFAAELEWICNNETPSLLNVAGSEPVSKYRFGLQLLTTMGFSTEKVTPVTMSEKVFKAPRCLDQTLGTNAMALRRRKVLPNVKQTIKSLIYHQNTRKG